MVAKMAMRKRSIILVVMESTGVYLAQIVHETAHVQKIQKYTDSRYRTEGENDFRVNVNQGELVLKVLIAVGHLSSLKLFVYKT